MTDWSLPVTIDVCGEPFDIRSDYRAVLDAIQALSAPELTAQERNTAALQILIPDWRRLPDAEEALRQAMLFINCGKSTESETPAPRLVDWSKDAPMIAPAVDKVLGISCRRIPYLHWWEFVGAYQCIDSKSLFAQVVSIRYKRAHGKKLETWERDFARDNAEMIHIDTPITAEEQAFLQNLGVE